MNLLRFTLLCTLIVYAFFSAPISAAASDDHEDQFIFGFEPTRTSFFIIKDNLKAIAQKLFFGVGKGILEIETPANQEARTAYLRELKKNHDELDLEEMRESHGTITYQVNYKNGFYIRSSLDAGALEWQTQPITLSQLEDEIPTLQKDIFDVADRAGVSRTFSRLGGHVTFSGFGGDTFWYGNYLKYRTENTFLDWGFFAKDDYNATPVKLWSTEQQQRYAQVHLEHDQKWEVFLKDLENKLEASASLDEIIAAFHSRSLLSEKEYGEKLLAIYYNPKLESPLLGKRSKPKYVANKPGSGIIENRAIVPQKNALQLLKLARFIEAELYYIKGKMQAGFEASFIPENYSELSAIETASRTRALIKKLGLKWEDYREFSPATSSSEIPEPKIDRGFVEKKYGSSKRDHLYQKVFDQFLRQPTWTPEQTLFFLNFAEERSYLVNDLDVSVRWVADRWSLQNLQSLNPHRTRQYTESILRLVEKFPSGRNLRAVLLASTIEQLTFKNIEYKNFTILERLLPYMNDPTRERLHAAIEQLKGQSLSAASLDLESILIKQSYDAHEQQRHLRLWIKKMAHLRTGEIPFQFLDVAKQLGDLNPEELKPFADAFIAHAQSSHEKYLPHLKWFAAQFPAHRYAFFRPLKNSLLEEIRRNQYGLTEHYRTLICLDLVFELTEPQEKLNFLSQLLVQFERMHVIKNDADSNALLERVKSWVRVAERQACALELGGDLQ